MRRGFQYIVAFVSVLLLSGFASSVVSAPAPGSLADFTPGPQPRSSGSSPKVHVVEGFTGTWCTWCGVFDPAVNRYADERDDAIFLAYHGPTTASDPLTAPAVMSSRGPFYTVFGYPTTIVDGGGANPTTDEPLYMLGAQRWSPESYEWLRDSVNSFGDTSSNLAVSLAGDLTPTTAVARASITATDPVPQMNLYVRFVLYEDQLYYPQTGRPDGQRGAGYHVNVARAIDETQALSIMQGQTVTKTVTFMIDPAWNPNKLGVAAFVQSGTRQPFTVTGYGTAYASDILNAAQYDFTPRGILLHTDTGTTADYADVYQEALAQAGERFEDWNTYVAGMDTGTTDIRGAPTTAALEESPGLVWVTGTRTAPVLTQATRDLVDTHLAGPGNFLITGSGLGFDGFTNYRTWYQTVLDANYMSDDTGVYTMTGVAGNPVSNAWAGTTLNIKSATSPDRVAAFGPSAQTAFQYTGGLPGGVNTVHDMDSRVVYLGMQYFENTADTNRASVLGDILDWFDGSASPTVDVVFPDGGETLAQGATVDIRWTAYDVRIPKDGVSVYFNDNYPSGPWQTLATGEPNDGVFRWTVPNIDSGSCRIRVVAADSDSSTADGAAVSQSDFICGQVPYFQVTFTAGDLGWHLISHPMIVADSSVPAVLGSIGGSYGIARRYDATDPADPWKAYVPGQSDNDLLYLDNTAGFWVQITQPCTLQVMGTRPSSPTAVPLRAGWNLVGFPSQSSSYTVAQLKADTGATRVEGFDNTASPYYLRVVPDAEALLAGRGYWVYVPADAIWMVPAT